MFERFTDRCRKTIAVAGREASRRGHAQITPAYLMSAIFQEGSSGVGTLLRKAGITPADWQHQMDRLLPAGSALPEDAKPPQSEAAKNAILFAIDSARERGQHWIGTEDLLLGLLHDPESDAVLALVELRVDVNALREQTLELLAAKGDPKTIRVGIVGVSGYGGGEALRLCAHHPRFQVVYVAGEGSAGQKLIERFPGIGALGELTIEKWNPASLPKLDLLFASLPTGDSKAALAQVPAETKIVDIGGDHRFVEGWTYGLADVWPDKIRAATRVANPGCYSAATLAALSPLVADGLVSSTGIIIDAKSGVSGAGRGGGNTLGFADVNEDVSAYALLKHAQVPEMTKALSALGSKEASLLFTPHLIPMTRGILATCYAQGTATTEQCFASARKFYEGRPSVRVVDKPPHTKWATGSNLVYVSYAADPVRGTVIAIGAIDNLGKGAAGQAVQNANLMMDLPEMTGLEGTPLWP